MCGETGGLMELFSAQQEFEAYGPSHLAVLGVFATGAALLVWIGRRQTESQARLFGRAFAVLIVAAFLVALVYKLIRPNLDTSVPLQLCDVAELTAAYALWSQRHWAFALTYYWCLVLSSQALITPDVGTPEEGAPDFPTIFSSRSSRFTCSWSGRPSISRGGVGCGRRGAATAVIATLAWAAFTFTFNAITGTNYGYLNRKPATASLLDVLGPWPIYLLTEVTIVLIVWALMTWPWERTRRHKNEGARIR